MKISKKLHFWSRPVEVGTNIEVEALLVSGRLGLLVKSATGNEASVPKSSLICPVRSSFSAAPACGRQTHDDGIYTALAQRRAVIMKQ